jgi:DNA helicase-2/ATP-dependent DNA helicase PcrA
LNPSKKLIASLIKPYKEYLISKDIVFTEGSALSSISRAKAKGQSAKAFFQEMDQTERQKRFSADWYASGSSETKSLARILAEIYIGYEQVLKDNNALDRDFDDLLVYGVKLFKEHYETALWRNIS